MKYLKKIEGERIYLSPVNPEDYEICAKWVNDPKVANNTGVYSKNYSFIAEKEWLEKIAKKGHVYAIVLQQNDKAIGLIDLTEIDYKNGTATLGILIGEEQYRGKGLGTEAMRLLIEYGFNTLNLRNIELIVFEFNDPAIKAYKKIGFKEFGKRTKSYYINGEYYDEIYMELLKDDWRK